MTQGLKSSPFDLPKIANKDIQWSDLPLQRGFTPYIVISSSLIKNYSEKSFLLDLGHFRKFIPKSLCKGFVQIEYSHNKHGNPTKLQGRYVVVPLWFAKKEKIEHEGKYLHVKKE